AGILELPAPHRISPSIEEIVFEAMWREQALAAGDQYMARPSIVEKLQPELRRPVKTEMQVVYILVAIRKLLEHGAQKDAYPVLNFYGNWVVHTKLAAS